MTKKDPFPPGENDAANSDRTADSLLGIYQNRDLSNLPTGERPLAAGPNAGDTIGSYKLLDRVGEGGMGEVWKARQFGPVKCTVALKIIKARMDSREIVERFEAERQALALVNHPNIAHLLGGGATESGRPYLVMEFVDGVPITDYCDHRKLGIRARLALFLEVCSAVHHAHHKGIIHNDLKPSNVLVTNAYGHPRVTVIDFGVAKITDKAQAERDVFTLSGQMIGTPAYMSPEQAQLSAENIDSRGDVYSLGVLLYELLTNSTPFQDQQLRHAAFDEMCRMIREVDPPRPSNKLSTLGQKSAEVASKHGTSSEGLNRAVRGDLDLIVMKALKKKKSRRYQTAKGFGDDVVRFLRREAVKAGPPLMLRRASRFLRRRHGRDYP